MLRLMVSKMKNYSTLSAVAFIVVSGILFSCVEHHNDNSSLLQLIADSPLMLSTIPVNGAINVSTGMTIEIFFSQNINQSSLSSSTIIFDPPIAGTYAALGPLVTFIVTPGVFLSFTQYTVTIPSGGVTGTN